MKLLKKHARGALCLLLAVSILGGTLLYAFGTAADDYEETLLGELSKDFESGDPGAISSGEGDVGGKSYGAFQFASNSDGPRQFFFWCLNEARPPEYRAIGTQLRQAYIDDPLGYGDIFDSVWVSIADTQYDAFLNAQRDYVEASYYQQAVNDIAEEFPGFDIANYSIALRNVILSRAVHHGSGGVVSVMDWVFGKLGGFKNQPETELIQAIYEESGEVREPDGRAGEEVMSGTTAEKYGVAGKVMSWFWASSSDMQIGLYMRLRINEPAKAQNMLAVYGYTDAPIPEGVYRFSPAGSPNLSIVSDNGALTLNATAKEKNQQFRFTYYASGYYIITEEQSGLRLTANPDGTLTMTAPAANNNQMWKLENLNSGFSVRNRATGHYLTAANAAAGDAVTGSAEAAQWQIVKAGSSWTLSGATYPTYANHMKEGYSFNLRGTLRCVDNIRNVTIRILNSSGSDAIAPSSSGALNSRSYDLSDLDSSVRFGQLSPGSYTFVIEAVSDGEEDHTYRMESKFYISDGSYLVTFDPCGGTTSKESMTVLAGQAYGVLPVAKKDGHFFVGWFTAPSGGTQVTSASITGAGNRTLYARYETAYTYTFYNYDDSVFATGQLRAGEVIPTPESTPKRPADAFFYSFAGWEGFTEGMTIDGNCSFKPLFTSVPLDAPSEMTTEAYRIEDELLRSIPLSTGVDTLLSHLLPRENVTVYKNGTPITEGAVGTGMTVVYAVDGLPLQTLTAVVTGDINGDGKYTITDMVQVQSHLLGRATLTGAALQAADLNGDGAVTVTDMVQATSALLGKLSIKPH